MGWLGNFVNGSSGPYIDLSGQRLTPEKFGAAVVGSSADGSKALVNWILEAGKNCRGGDTIYTRLKANPAVAQFQIMPLYIAIHEIALIHLDGASKPIALAFRSGMQDCLRDGPFKGDALEPMMHLVRHYGRLLMVEVQSITSGEAKVGGTADAATDFVCTGLAELDVYRALPPLRIDLNDRTAITLVVATGIASQFKSLAELNLRIVPG